MKVKTKVRYCVEFRKSNDDFCYSDCVYFEKKETADFFIRNLFENKEWKISFCCLTTTEIYEEI